MREDARPANRPPTRDDDDGITHRRQQHGCHVQFHTAQMMGKSSYDMPARAISRLVCVCLGVGVCVCVGFGLVLTRQKITTVMDQSRKKYSSSYYDYERRRLLDVSEFDDPRTVTVKEGEGVLMTSSLYVVPEIYLEESKLMLPAIVQSRPPEYDHQGLVVDVLSVGSRTRPEYMTAQINTWASHVHVRHFWGINEEQDYDHQCDQMDTNALQSYIKSCQGDMGWKNIKLERFRQSHFGAASGMPIESRNAGWFCAQRRPGHGLGWLMEMYRDATNIPDVLMIVDDDTSVDIENLKRAMQQHSDFAEGLPFVGSGCTYDLSIGFVFTFGGFGTFFNGAAIHQLTQPIYCNTDESSQEQQQHHSDVMALSCAELQKNTIGELDVFQNGDSAFDIFYKYSTTPQFCLHSDWALGYMVSHYLHKHISTLEPRCKGRRCDFESITCHNHGPEEMESFVQSHLSK